MSFIADVLDPGHFFHDTDSDRLAKKQYNTEADIAYKNYEHQLEVDDFNTRMQQEVFDYQKQLNALQMEREDNAIARRVADLKASGLSPTLAAGSPASSTPVRAGTAPQADATIKLDTPSDVRVRQAMFKEQMLHDKMQMAMSIMGNIADVSRTKAETEMIKAKTGEQDVINKYLDDYLSKRNEGLGLSNVAQNLANNFNLLANPARLNEMQTSISVMKKNLDILKWDEKIKTNEALRQIYYNQKARFEADLAGQNVEIAKLRRANIDVDTLCKAYTLKYAEDRGIPLHGINQWQVVYDVIHEIKNWISPPSAPDGLQKYMKPDGQFDWNSYMQDINNNPGMAPF